MREKNNFFVFFLFLFLSIFVFGLSKISALEGFRSFFEELPKITTRSFNFLKVENQEVEALKKENAALVKKLIDQKTLEKDTKALKDQFQVSLLRSQTLMPAKVVGSPGLLPGVSEPEVLILDKGSKDNIYQGQPVVVDDHLVAIISRVSLNLSVAELITSKNFSIPAKTLLTDALGLTKGEGEKLIILDNVLLSEELKVDDLVVTKGSLDEKGKGVPPNLVIGKITSIEKQPSALFQKASLRSLISFPKLTTVFLIMP